LGWYGDNKIALDNGLARQGITLIQRFSRQTRYRPTLDITVLHDHGAAATSPLPATRHIQFYANLPGCLADDSSWGDLRLSVMWLEGYNAVGQVSPLRATSRCRGHPSRGNPRTSIKYITHLLACQFPPRRPDSLSCAPSSQLTKVYCTSHCVPLPVSPPCLLGKQRA
jgi:hypothetical protein